MGKTYWSQRLAVSTRRYRPRGDADGCDVSRAREEVGLHPRHVDLLAVTQDWLRYRLPKRYVRHGQQPLCIGQKQKWFLLRLDEPNTQHIRFDEGKPEFDHWQWVSYWYPLGQVIHFKRGVYRRALQELVRELPLRQELIIPEQDNHLLIE